MNNLARALCGALVIGWTLLAASAGHAQHIIAVPDGYATQNGGTTGGGNATPTTVTTAAAFRDAVGNNDPAVIVVQGRLNVGTVSIGSNKTIVGAGTTSGLYGGGIRVGGSNYIFQNLTIGPAEGDTFEISGATNVFVYKCEFYGSTDELCSIVREADFVTVCWSKFYFPDPDSHSFAHLIGNGDGATGDRGKLHVTLHHNWYDDGVRGRMPRVRFGHVHIYNNYYNSNSTGYCVGVGFECHIRLENTHFDDVNSPWADYDDDNDNGEIGWAGLKFTNTSQPTFVANSFPVFTPPYPYTMDSVDDLQTLLTDPVYGAGNRLARALIDDSEPPEPDPLTWAVEPMPLSESEITMTATTATDLSGVEYYFANQTHSSHDSGWQSSPTYVDTALTPLTTYTYTVRARDTNVAQNQGQPSAPRSATTLAPDTTPPSPSPMTWTVEPHAEGAAIAMTATTASDPSGVEYYFANLTDSSHDSGWQSDPSYADIGLLLNTQYTYTVTARDLSVGMNQTAPSAQASATTTDAAPVHINFQPDDVAIPSGFIPDYGAVFGDRGGGLFYGWNIDHTTEPRDRDNHAQHELDTICHMLEGAAWEWAAANGEYIIEVTIGDPSFSSTHTINVEGVNYWNQAFLGAGEFQTLSRTIQVTDGRITLDQGPAPNRATRICHLTITPLAQSQAAVPPTHWTRY